MLRGFALVVGLMVALASGPVWAQGAAGGQGADDGLRAYQALAGRNWDLAVFYATRAIEAGALPDGDRAAVHAYRADALRHKGEFAAAIDDYDIGLEIGYPPAFRARVLNNRGIAFYAVGLFDLAIEDYTEALELEPSFGAALDNRGTSYMSMGFFEFAIEDFGAAIELDANNYRAFNNRGRAFLELRFYDEAIADFTAALYLGSPSVTPIFNRAMAYEGLGDRDRAFEDLAIAHRMSPDEPTYQEKFQEYGLLQ